MSQTGIRIVGLSATLPNYVDVARFLRVNPYKGLFYFDGRFRPVPLTQKFIGIKKVGGVREVQETMNEVCYDEVLSYVKKGHQVLVFVHARNATASLAQAFRERAAQLHAYHAAPLMKYHSSQPSDGAGAVVLASSPGILEKEYVVESS
ncbi:hypothetical protein TELCIR_19861 [Teladorsagia circumcincta]|uniref:Helicase ATP-binding domain-containing protein n=1 Tax=Teladorsagia circumcincta TaxID=45464 RepID=A0A2G9TMX6_TELCI|nr:hypothetical protein TELCIR_19861 [Teladorsagia circumcincta]